MSVVKKTPAEKAQRKAERRAKQALRDFRRKPVAGYLIKKIREYGSIPEIPYIETPNGDLFVAAHSIAKRLVTPKAINRKVYKNRTYTGFEADHPVRCTLNSMRSSDERNNPVNHVMLVSNIIGMLQEASNMEVKGSVKNKNQLVASINPNDVEGYIVLLNETVRAAAEMGTAPPTTNKRKVYEDSSSEMDDRERYPAPKAPPPQQVRKKKKQKAAVAPTVKQRQMTPPPVSQRNWEFLSKENQDIAIELALLSPQFKELVNVKRDEYRQQWEKQKLGVIKKLEIATVETLSTRADIVQRAVELVAQRIVDKADRDRRLVEQDMKFGAFLQ